MALAEFLLFGGFSELLSTAGVIVKLHTVLEDFLLSTSGRYNLEHNQY